MRPCGGEGEPRFPRKERPKSDTAVNFCGEPDQEGRAGSHGLQTHGGRGDSGAVSEHT